jgi:outer membrane beta-barrel protein
MKATKRFTYVLAGLVLLTSWAHQERASAEDVQVTGPLAGAPAVRHMRVFREGRLQLQPFVGFTLQDEYSRTIFVGGQLNYHITDWLGIGVWGAFGAIHIDTGLTDEVTKRGQSTDRNRLSLPTAQNFPDQIGIMKWAAAFQGTFIPLRGKLALFQSIFLDTDLYVFAGLAGVGVEERADVAANTCTAGMPSQACLDSQVARTSRVALAPTFGAGLTLYANSFIGVTLEWRALPFAWNTSGTDERGRDTDGNLSSDGQFPDGRISGDDRIFQFNHMVNIGIAFYLPTSVDISD